MSVSNEPPSERPSFEPPPQPYGWHEGAYGTYADPRHGTGPRESGQPGSGQPGTGYGTGRAATPAAPLPTHQPYGVTPRTGSYPPPTAPAEVPEEPPTTPPAAAERVGRGLALASLGIVAGAVLSAWLHSVGFVASIVAYGMALLMAWLYAQGAGARPRRGGGALIALMVVGLVLAWLATLWWTIHGEAIDAGFTGEQAVALAFAYLLDPELLTRTAGRAGFFFLLGAIGIYGTARQILASRGS